MILLTSRQGCPPEGGHVVALLQDRHASPPFLRRLAPHNVSPTRRHDAFLDHDLHNWGEALDSLR